MKIILQRVSSASVTIDGKKKAEIANGFLILLGIGHEDTAEDMDWIVNKALQMRVFDDNEGVMNVCLKDIDGEILLISQFTLMANTKKGNRPSYIQAARPEQAIPIYEEMIQKFKQQLGKEIKTGEFGADMKVALVNDGPVTIVLDSKNKG